MDEVGETRSMKGAHDMRPLAQDSVPYTLLPTPTGWEYVPLHACCVGLLRVCQHTVCVWEGCVPLQSCVSCWCMLSMPACHKWARLVPHYNSHPAPHLCIAYAVVRTLLQSPQGCTGKRRQTTAAKGRGQRLSVSVCAIAADHCSRGQRAKSGCA